MLCIYAGDYGFYREIMGNNKLNGISYDCGQNYWEYAQNYALDIYNNIPPLKTPKGQVPMSPNEKFYEKKEDISLYKVFGCRAFVNIPKQVRRKNLNARSTQGIFIGLDRSSYPVYMVYSSEFHTTYVSGDVVFHQGSRYDSKYIDTTNKTLSKSHIHGGS